MVAVAEPSLRPIVSFAILGTLLTTGHALRARIRVLRVLSLPASCIGGIVGLVARQLLLRTSHSAGQFLDRELIVGWTDLPSLLTNVVFVTRFNTPEPAQHPPRAFRAPCAAHAARRARPRPRKPNQKLRRRERTANDRRRCLSTADSKVQRYARAAL